MVLTSKFTINKLNLSGHAADTPDALRVA